MNGVLKFSAQLQRSWILAALLFSFSSDYAYAQRTGTNFAFDSKYMSVGEFSSHYTSGGALSPEGPWASKFYPSWNRYTQNMTGNALWVSAKNFTGPFGRHWDANTAHVGYYTSGVGEVHPESITMYSKIDAPIVYVDGLETTNYPIIYDEQGIDTLEGDAMVRSVTNTPMGITVTQNVHSFSNEFHDNYHITEFIYTNTGTWDNNEVLPEQTLTDVWFTNIRAYAVNSQAGSIVGNGAGWGRNTINDVVGDGLKQYDTDFRAQYSWLAEDPRFGRWNNIGGPALTDDFNLVLEGDSVGRLTADHFIGFTTLHADESATSKEDNPQQPAVVGYVSNGWPLLSADPGNQEKTAQEYAIFEGGEIESGALGSQLDFITGPPASQPETPEEWRRRAANQREDPGVDIEGFNHITAYGPYTLEPGQSVRIVVAEGAAGLSDRAALEIGNAFKVAHLAGDENRDISFDADRDGTIAFDEQMSKNEWVMTSRDSLFQMFRMARANFESDFAIPSPPLPPSEFRVISSPDEIVLEWDTYPEADQNGFEIYRTVNRVEGNYTDYDLIATVGPEVRSYEDNNVQRGIGYFYYIRAVGDINNDATGMTPTEVPLKSGRAYTQTYDPAFLKRSPGDSMEDAQVVPNPYILSSQSDVRWPDQRDRIGFLDVPGQSTIRIFTELGELIQTIGHTDGSGDAFWDLTTSSNQLIVTGIYIAVIQDNETGDQVMRKFVVVR